MQIKKKPKNLINIQNKITYKFITEDETIYCELVQWCDDCTTGDCVILAQYLGAINDVLFPPNMCSTDGVDLLMRRSKDFPVNTNNIH